MQKTKQLIRPLAMCSYTVQPQFSCHVHFSFPFDVPSRIPKVGSAVIYIPKCSWLPYFEKRAAEYWPDIQPSELALGLVDAGPGRQKRGASAGPEVPQGRTTATMTIRTLKAPLPYCTVVPLPNTSAVVVIPIAPRVLWYLLCGSIVCPCISDAVEDLRMLTGKGIVFLVLIHIRWTC